MSVTSPQPYVYQQAPLVTDPSVLKGQVVAYMQGYMPPGFQIPSGSWLDLLIEALCIQAAQQADVAQAKLDSDFRYFGSLVKLPPIDAVPAQATATFTVTPSPAAQTIPAGSAMGIMDSTGTLQGFDLAADLVVAANATTAAGTVIAETAGTGTNGLSGAATLISTPTFVTAATLSTAVGGVDAELDADYLNRLTETLGLLTPIPVLATNYAVLARSIAGVYRATGVNGLKPGPPYDTVAEASGQDKNVTVAVADINGQPVGSTIRGNVQTYLQGLREQNFEIWVVDPQYQTIDVTSCPVYSWPGWDPGSVQAAVVAALEAALSPATFATDPSGVAARWANDPVVHASALYQAVMSTPGVRNVNPILFGVHGVNLAAPTGLTGTPHTGGGTFAASTQYAKVTAYNSAGETVGSAEASATVAASGTITWAWSAVSGATGYRLYRAATAGAESTGSTRIADTAALSFVDTGAAPAAAAMPTVNTAEAVGTGDLTLGAGSAIPALPQPGTITVTVTATTA